MMKYAKHEIKVVIGASYGDEGKGLMTNYFCEKAAGKPCLTVLHNGGAQRGHTVAKRDGARHVFHHLSSGTLSGADTFFADTFIINPLVFRGEYSELCPDTRIFCSPRCKWSTPFDMMINQIAEDSRGDARHGSCGYGIWETLVRYDSAKPVAFPDFILMNLAQKREYLKNIRGSYLSARLSEIGVKNIPDEWREILSNNNLIENFIEDCVFFREHVIFTENSILENYPYIVFEGAQGLLLNQDLGENERHTTPSFTGAENPVRLITELSGESTVEVCYVTRTYLTRHGAGPFPGECEKSEINPAITDNTNVPNAYQGAIRYGKLDITKLRERISTDFAKFRAIKNCGMSLAITHMNETDGQIITPSGGVSPKSIGEMKKYLSFAEIEEPMRQG